jgi:hypothetical protein
MQASLHSRLPLTCCKTACLQDLSPLGDLVIRQLNGHVRILAELGSRCLWVASQRMQAVLQQETVDSASNWWLCRAEPQIHRLPRVPGFQRSFYTGAKPGATFWAGSLVNHCIRRPPWLSADIVFSATVRNVGWKIQVWPWAFCQFHIAASARINQFLRGLISP